MAASRRPVPQCPIRPGDPCSLCVPGATGPHDCGLVYLVQDDPEMAAELARRRSEVRRTGRGAPDRHRSG
ncbi:MULTISPECIES: DUF6767 domain-containing protein [unclassified Ornithinimicrobium]|uniref:DUF6767 domain-containing protein n=1 Tax=unclassified Ornithinimicrobium TaxID=2615080 RepID=UPI0038533F6A